MTESLQVEMFGAKEKNYRVEGFGCVGEENLMNFVGFWGFKKEF